MKIKIVEPGWESFTGHLGPVEFVDGVSVDHVGKREAQRIAGSIRVEDVDTGVNPSVSQEMVDTKDREAELSVVLMAGEGDQPPVESNPAPAQTYTREQLEQIGDEGGIKALREIGDTLDVRSNSIGGLIDAILEKAAAPVAAEVAAPVEGEPTPEA